MPIRHTWGLKKLKVTRKILKIWACNNYFLPSEISIAEMKQELIKYIKQLPKFFEINHTRKKRSGRHKTNIPKIKKG